MNTTTALDPVSAYLERATMNGKPVLRVPVKTVLSMGSGFKEKLLCDGPVMSVGEGCAYSCSFCYVPSVYQKLDRVREVLERAGLNHEDVVILRDGFLGILRGQLCHDEGNGKPRFLAEGDNRVLYASPADDVAANMDLVRITAEACKLILVNTNWQIRLLSKSTLLPKLAAILVEWAKGPGEREFAVARNYGGKNPETEVFRRMIFGVSTGTLDQDVAHAIEEGTPLVSKRIESLRMLQDCGFRTYAMICPSLPQADVAGYAEFSERARAELNYERCEHVWAEVINVRGDSFTRTKARLLEAGFNDLANRIDKVSHDRDAWEDYNRATFLAHAKACENYTGKLRFLTYIKPHTRGWWEKHIARGAVIL